MTKSCSQFGGLETLENLLEEDGIEVLGGTGVGKIGGEGKTLGVLGITFETGKGGGLGTMRVMIGKIGLEDN